MTVKVRTQLENSGKQRDKDDNTGIRNRFDNPNYIKGILFRKGMSPIEKDSRLREIKIAEAHSTNNGQNPDILLISEVGLSLSNLIYGGLPTVKDGIQNNGVFGNVGIQDKDYAQFAYMINHLIHSNKRIPFLVFFAEDNEVDKIKIIGRKRKFITDYISSGRLYDAKNDRLSIAYHNKENVELIPIIVLYNKDEGKFYTYDEKTGAKQYISELRNNPTANDKIRDLIVQKLGEAEKDKRTLNKKLELAKEYMSFRCCDSRTHSFGGAGYSSKVLGALLTRDDLKELLKQRPNGTFLQEVHTTCGYLTSAVRIYLLLKGLVKANDAVRNAVVNELIGTYGNGSRKLGLDMAYFNLAKNNNTVEENQRELFIALFESSTRDYQNILIHMIDLGVITLLNSDKRIQMNAYENVTDRLKYAGKVVDFKVLVYLITEEIARYQAQMVRDEAARLERHTPMEINVEWYLAMHSLSDNARYEIAETLKGGMNSEFTNANGEFVRRNEFGKIKRIKDIV